MYGGLQVNFKCARPGKADVCGKIVDLDRHRAFWCMDENWFSESGCMLVGGDAILHGLAQQRCAPDIVVLEIQIIDIWIASFFDACIDETDDIFQIIIVFKVSIVEESQVILIECKAIGTALSVFKPQLEEAGLGEGCADCVASCIPAGISNKLVQRHLLLDEERK